MATVSNGNKPLTDTREMLNVMWLGVALPTIGIGLLADWYGQTQIICVVGLLTTLNLFSSYWVLKGGSDRSEALYQVKDGQSLPPKLRLYSLILALHAATAMLVTDLHLHFVMTAPGGLVEGLQGFDWNGTWELGALVLLSVLAFASGTVIDPRRIVSRSVKVLSTVAFVVRIPAHRERSFRANVNTHSDRW